MNTDVFTLPRLGAIARQAAPHVFEATLIPLALFYAGYALFGFTVAVLATMGWAYAALARRFLTGRPIPGMLLISALLLTARTVVSLLTGSAFLYFLQPTLGGVLVALAFGASVFMGRPLCERLAAELVPLPDHVATAPWIRAFFARITVLWAATFALNAVASLWLLMDGSIGTFLIGRTAISTGLTLVAIAVSTVAFIRTARRNHLRVVRPTAGSAAAI